MKAKWKRSSDYVKFARAIGCDVKRVFNGVVKVTPLSPVQKEMLETFQHQQELDTK